MASHNNISQRCGKQLMVICAVLFIGGMSNIVTGQSTVQYEEPGIARLMEKYKAQNSEITHIKGFRIQVASTTDRVKIQQEAGAFAYHFPDMKADWVNEKPYYKLRVGAYANKLSCLYILKKIQEHFPGAYVVVDNSIPISEVRNM